MMISELFTDCPVVLKDDDKFYSLEWDNELVDGLTERPVIVFVKKGMRIYKKNLQNYEE